ncbi:MAG: SBBP repeat-containing protein, partial [Thermodesulfobacteriota bacterium]
IDGKRKEIDGKFVIESDSTYGFKVASYDKTKELVIDPTLNYSTYFGGNGSDEDMGYGIAVDSSGAAYVTGTTDASSFPGLTPIYTYSGGIELDVFVTKINAAGSGIVYFTYLGGTGSENAPKIAVDSSGAAYVTGRTNSTNFPTAPAAGPPFAIDSSLGGTWDAFVTKINAAGDDLVYSTYLGGTDTEFGSDIAVDLSGAAYVTGQTGSTDFPTFPAGTPIDGSLSGAWDTFVTKINIDGLALEYSTYLGGTGADYGKGIVVDSSGAAYVTGWTTSTDLPVSGSAYQGSFASGWDAFVTKVNAAGTALSYLTYLGGTENDYGNAIAVDISGAAYVTGTTDSTDFPTSYAMYGSHAGGGGSSDAFVTKINSDGSDLVYSTYLGGTGVDSGLAIDVVLLGTVYVTGSTGSTDFPTASAIYGSNSGVNEAFVTEINTTGTALIYSTYLGGSGHDYGRGIAVDATGSAYVTGDTTSTDFPLGLSPIDASNSGLEDAFVVKIGPALIIDTTCLSFGIKDADYAAYVMVSGGDGDYTWSVSSGSLPDGLNLDLSTGLISGTPTANGPTDFTIQVSDGNANTDTQAYTLSVYDSIVLDYSTYLGGTGNDSGWAIAVDSWGLAYVAGETSSSNFPIKSFNSPVKLAYQGSYGAAGDIFVTKIHPDGLSLVYSTYIGGVNGGEIAYGIASDSGGNAYITGITLSSDFPTASAIYGTKFSGFIDSFVTKLNVYGSALEYSTYLGGTGDDFGNAIAVDLTGAAYVTGKTNSTDFPTVAAYDRFLNDDVNTSNLDAFVTKINPAGSALIYSTYLGGVGNDTGTGIAVDSLGSAYVTGETYSADFTVSASAIDSTLGGTKDAFVTKVNATGSDLTYSTYLGGTAADHARAIAVDSSGSAYVTGETYSTDFPTFPVGSPIDGELSGTRDAFVTKINPVGSALTYSTFLGGEDIDIGNGIIVDSSGNAYVTGRTDSSDFPTASPLYSSLSIAPDAFVTKINAAGTAFSYSTFLGGTDSDIGNGIAVDCEGAAYVVGSTSSIDFPTVPNMGETNDGNQDAFVTKIIGGPSFFYLNESHGALPSGMVDDAYSETAIVSGGIEPHKWTISSGNLPSNFKINTFTGEIHGTPTTTGYYTFDVTVTDAYGHTSTVSLIIIVNSVDIAIHHHEVPPKSANADEVSVTVTVTNLGPRDAGRFFIYFFISTDAVVSNEDKLMGYRALWAGLDAGVSDTFTVRLTKPNTLGTGTYNIIAVADYLGDLPDGDETNDVKAVLVYPDLLVTALSGPSKVTAGAAIQITDTITNQGHMAAGDTDVNYYLSTDSIITTSDIYLGSRPIWGRLDTEATNTATSSHTVLADTPAGTYYLGAIVDAGDAIAESNDSDNSRATSGTVTVSAGMDLIVSALSGPSTGGRGDTISLTSTVKNQGTGSTGNVAVNFYLSLDSTITTSDIYIGYRPIWGSMAPGATNTATSTQHTIPAGTALGTYYLGAI